MNLRRWLGALPVALLLAGCGGASSPSSSSPTTSASATTSTGAATSTSTSTSPPVSSTATNPSAPASTTTTTSAAAPPEASSGTATATGRRHGSSSSDVSIPAAFRIGAQGALTPSSVSVPAGVPIALAVTDVESQSYTVVLAAPRRHTLHVPAHSARGALIAGLPAGTYRLLIDGVPRGEVVAGAQGGP